MKDLRTILELRSTEIKARNASLACSTEKNDKLTEANKGQKAATEKALADLQVKI